MFSIVYYVSYIIAKGPVFGLSPKKITCPVKIFQNKKGDSHAERGSKIDYQNALYKHHHTPLSLSLLSV